MKRIKYLVATIIGVMFFTGCAIKLDVNMQVSKDGKIDFGLIQAFDRELITNMMNMGGSETTYTDGELKQFLKQSLEESEEGETSDLDVYKQKGFTATEYLDDKFLGYKFAATIDNIDNVSTTTDVSFNFSDISKLSGTMQEQKIFKKTNNQYVAHFIFDPKSSSTLGTEDTETDGNEETDDSSNEQMEQYLNMIEQIYTFTLTLPKTPISHNATTVSEDGKTLTWTLSKDSKTDINFTFVLEDTKAPIADNNEDNSSLWLYIALGIGALVLIVVVVLLLTRKKEETKEDDNQPITPVQEYNSNLNNISIPDDNKIMPITELPSNEEANETVMPIENPTTINSQAIQANNELTNKFCTNCGTKIVENNNFCTNCGNKLK